MFSISKQKGLSTIPVRCPSPDIGNRGSILFTRSPQLKMKGLTSRSLSSQNMMIEEISKLRRQNHRLREEMMILRKCLRERKVIERRDSKSTPYFFEGTPKQSIDDNQKSRQEKDQQGKLDYSSEKDILIARLKGQVNNLEKKLDQVTLIDSAKLANLQKQNKTLKEVISMNLGFDQQNLKRVNEKLNLRISQLQSQNFKLRLNKQTVVAEGKPLKNSQQKALNYKLYQQIFERMQDVLDEKYGQFLGKCDEAESRMFHFQNMIEEIKAKLVSRKIRQQQNASIKQQNQKIDPRPFNSGNKKSTKQGSSQTQGSDRKEVVKEKLPDIFALQAIYKQELQQSKNTIISPHEVINSLNDQILAYEEEIKLLKQSNLPDRQNVKTLQNRIEQLSITIQQMENNHNLITQQLAISNQNARDQAVQNQRLKESNSYLENQLAQLEVKNQNDNTAFSTRIRQLEEQIRMLAQNYDKRIQVQDAVIQNKINEIQRFQSLNKELTDQIKQMQNTPKGNTTIQNYKNSSQQNQIIKQLKSHIQQLETANEQLRDDIQKLQDMLINVQSILQTNQEEKNRLHNQLNQGKLLNEQLRQQLDIKDAFLEQILQQVNSTKEILKKVNLDELKSQIRSLSLSEQYNQLRQKEKTIMGLEKDIMMSNEFKASLLELEHRNIQLSHINQEMIASEQVQKESSSHLEVYIQQLKNVINTYVHSTHAKQLTKNNEHNASFAISADLQKIQDDFMNVQNHVLNAQKFILSVCNSNHK